MRLCNTANPVSRWSGCQKYLAETPTGVYRVRPTGTDDGRAGRKCSMSEEKKKEIKEMVGILKELDKESLLILSTGAQMLKTRQEMDIKNSVANCAHE